MTHKMLRASAILTLAAGSLLAAAGHGSALPVGFSKIGMVCTPGNTTGNTFNLVANTGYIETPDGNSVFMWSYANAGPPDNGHFQSPGPVLCVTQGQTVTVHLHNTLPEATSIIFPGQEGVTATGGSAGLLAREAPNSANDVTYSFIASAAGTYLYESGTDVAKQVEMGLYGALVVRPSAGANLAYGTSTQFDPSREYLLLLAEMDPFLHHAVEAGTPYDFNSRNNRYFTINGRSFPDTVQDNGSALLPNQPYGALVRIQPTTNTTQPALIRMVNAGVDNHPFHPHGNHTTQIAQDARLLTNPAGTADAFTEHFGETIGAGQTEDFLLRWDDQDHWSPVNNPPTSNPLPVPPPNYRDVTFKDGNTWYSGSPYLGYKGTLPAGTTTQNICGEWYFPWHSHALNEFTNFDEGFGGMGTLLRVDPPGGCFTTAASTVIVGGVLKSGSVSALAASDSAYYQVNPKTTTLISSPTSTTITVASATGFPTSGTYYIRIDNEVLQVTGGQGTTTWTVARAQLGTGAGTHAAGATISALANDWYGSFSGVKAGSTSLKVTYQGRNCGNTTGTTCVDLTANMPLQTVKICNWTIAGAAGCSTATSAGWVTLPPPPAQPTALGSAEPLASTWSLPNPVSGSSPYIGTGSYNGQVRVFVHNQRWTAPNPTTFSTWGNLLALTYDAP